MTKRPSVASGIPEIQAVETRFVTISVYPLKNPDRFAVSVYLRTAFSNRAHAIRVPWGPPIPVAASTFPEALREAARQLQAVARDLDR